MQKDQASQESKETGQAEETLPVIVPDTQDNPDTEEQANIEEEKPGDSPEGRDQERHDVPAVSGPRQRRHDVEECGRDEQQALPEA